MPVIYYSKSAEGVGDGTSALNAKAIADLPTDLGAQGATSNESYEYRIVSNRYKPTHYQTPSDGFINPTVSGTVDHPTVLVAGAYSASVSHLPSDEGFRFYGDQKIPFIPSGMGGLNGSIAMSKIAASNIIFDGFRSSGLGYGGGYYFVSLGLSNVKIRNHHGLNDSLIMRINQSEGSVDGLSVTDSSVKNTAFGGIYAESNTLTNSEFKRLYIDMGALDGRGYAAAFFIGDNNTNITVEDVIALNGIDSLGSNGNPLVNDYVQGDGFVIEDTFTGTLNRCFASGFGDAGFDIKASNVTCDKLHAEFCKFPLRIWGNGPEFNDCKLVHPLSFGLNAGACIESAGGIATLNNCELDADNRSTCLWSDLALTTKGGAAIKTYSQGGTGNPTHLTFNRGVINAGGVPVWRGDVGDQMTFNDTEINGSIVNGTFTMDATGFWNP